MFCLFALAIGGISVSPLASQGAPPQGGADQPYTVEYYYKVQWGHQQEFLDLFLKNHYPLLQEDRGDRAHAFSQRSSLPPTTPPKMAAGITG